MINIAILDDYPNASNFVCQALKSCGYRCDVLHSGEDFLMQWPLERYDLLIVDRQIPDMSGVEIAQKIKNACPSNIPILLITSCFNDDGISACLGADADDYMIKPIRVTELIGRVQALLRHTSTQKSAHMNSDVGNVFDYPRAMNFLK